MRKVLNYNYEVMKVNNKIFPDRLMSRFLRIDHISNFEKKTLKKVRVKFILQSWTFELHFTGRKLVRRKYFLSSFFFNRFWLKYISKYFRTQKIFFVYKISRDRFFILGTYFFFVLFTYTLFNNISLFLFYSMEKITT